MWDRHCVASRYSVCIRNITWRTVVSSVVSQSVGVDAF